MSKTTLRLFLLCALLCTALSTFKLDTSKSHAFLNAGNCYIYPAAISPSSQQIQYNYYDLPFGWQQFDNYLVVPDLLAQRGDWRFGLRVQDQGSSVNEMFRITVDGLRIRLVPVTQSVTINLVIGSNYRTSGINDQTYQNFIQSLRNRPSTTTSSSSGSSISLGSFNLSNFPSSSLTTTITNLISSTRPQTSQFFPNTPSSSTNISITNERNAALTRQFNAGQALGELTALIAQLNSSVNSAQQNIASIQQRVDAGQRDASECNDKIL